MTTKDFRFKRLEELHMFYKLTFFGKFQNYITRHLGRTATDALKPSSRKADRVSLRTITKLEQHAAKLGFKSVLSSETESTETPELRCPACRTRLRVILTLPPLDMGLSGRPPCPPTEGLGGIPTRAI